MNRCQFVMVSKRATLACALIMCCSCVPLVAITPWQCRLKETCDLEVEMNATTFLEEFDYVQRQNMPAIQHYSWMYYTNMTDYNKEEMTYWLHVHWTLIQDKAAEGSSIPLDALCSEATRRQLKAVLKHATVPTTDAVNDLSYQLSHLTTTMTLIFNTVDSCIEETADGFCHLYDWDVLMLSRNETERQRAWLHSYDAYGKRSRPLFDQYVQARNELYNLTGTNSSVMTEEFKAVYGTGEDDYDYEEDMELLLMEVTPLVKLINAYIRRRLREIYGDYIYKDTPLLSHHLTIGIESSRDFMPFPNHTVVSITDELRRQNYTVLDMYRTAEDFFTSLNLSAMPDSFWNNSMMEQPDDWRRVECLGSAWDFYDGEDFRIMMCTYVEQDHFYVVHHEMGHIQYFLQNKHLPIVLRDVPNPGFHEALGDTVSLSVRTSKHLKAIGLLDKDTPEDYEADINFLMSLAMDKVHTLPNFFISDKYRWDIFSNRVPDNKYNKHYWDLLCKYKGVVPPVNRTEEDFDAGSTYQVVTNEDVIKYFVSTVFQFQFYEALCNATNHTGPLYKCDFYNNTVAGDKLREFMRLGLTIPWPDALERFTGSRKMDIGPIMRYFQPLNEYLEEVNEGEELDWEGYCDDITYVTPC